MIKIKYKEFDSKEELEFEFLKELDIEEELVEENITNSFGRIFYNINLVKILKIIERKIIFLDNNSYGQGDYLVFNENKSLNLKVGDVINFEPNESHNRYASGNEDKDADIFKIDNEVLDITFLEKCKKRLEGYSSITKPNSNILKREDFEKKIEYLIKESKKSIENEIKFEAQEEKNGRTSL